MKRLLIVLSSLAVSAAAWAQHEGHDMPDRSSVDGQPPADEHAEHDTSAPPAGHESSDAHSDHGVGASSNRDPGPTGESAPPPAAFSGPAHAADTFFDPREMAAARAQLRADEGGALSYLVLADRFEVGSGDEDERYLWDVQGWFGGDFNKLWLKSEGAGPPGENPEDAEVQALYSRAITPYFDFQAGIRHDLAPDPEASHAVVGVQGLLPQVFEIDAAAFLSDEGDLTGRFEAEYDLRITQRLILQPRIELDFAAQAIPEHGIGSGLGSIEGGFRLRYEFRREISPYIGVAWERKLGATADYARASGEERRSVEAVAGIRMWF